MNSDAKERIWNPSEIGPFGHCMKCFEPLGEDFAYCSRCGHVSTVFDTPAEATGIRCQRHTTVNAIAYCCLCADPICERCNSKDSQGFSMAAGFRELYRCVRCVQERKELERQFKEHTEQHGACAKHRDTKAIFDCIRCDLLLCNQCSYFRNKGWIRKRLGDGPYCLACFRSVTLGGGRAGWISGREASERGFLE